MAHETPGRRNRAVHRARPVLHVARQCDWCRALLGGLEIRLKGVDRNLESWIGIRAPQLASLEHYGIQPLRIVPAIYRNRIPEHVTALAKLDIAKLSSGIARQPLVGRSMNIAGMYAIAHLETWRSLLLAEE